MIVFLLINLLSIISTNCYWHFVTFFLFNIFFKMNFFYRVCTEFNSPLRKRIRFSCWDWLPCNYINKSIAIELYYFIIPIHSAKCMTQVCVPFINMQFLNHTILVIICNRLQSIELVTASYWVSPIIRTNWCYRYACDMQYGACARAHLCVHWVQSKQLQVHMVLHWMNSMMAHSSGNSCILDFLLSHIFKSDCPVVATAAVVTADTCWIWACGAVCCGCCCYCTLLLSMTSIPKLKRITLKYTCVHCLQCEARWCWCWWWWWCT